MTGCHINRYKIIVECPSCLDSLNMSVETGSQHTVFYHSSTALLVMFLTLHFSLSQFLWPELLRIVVFGSLSSNILSYNLYLAG